MGEYEEEEIMSMSYLELIALDEAIAVEIMGWRRDAYRWFDASDTYMAYSADYPHRLSYEISDRIFRPTLHVKFAFQVVAKLAEMGMRLRLADHSDMNETKWHARFYGYPKNALIISEEAETPELAICRAAIAAIRREKGEGE